MTGPRSDSSYPQGDHRVSVADAAAWTAAFRAKNPNGVRAWMFDRRALDVLLAQPACMGIRIYRAHKDGVDQVVLVGTDSAGNDVTPANLEGQGVVMEIAWPCPPMCGAKSLLNS